MAKKEFKVVRVKFKVGNNVTEKQVEAKLKAIKGFENLSLGVSDTMIEVTVDGEVFTKQKPKPPEEPKEEKEK